jgi:hypothetical protein
VACSAIGAGGITGHAFSVQAGYFLTVYTQMAVHTALLMTLLGLAILFVNSGEGIAGVITSAGPGGAMARTLLPFVIVGPFVLGWLRLERQHCGFYGTEFGVAILVMVSTSSLAAVVMLYASRIDRAAAAAWLAEREARATDERFRLAVSAARIGACEMDLATERAARVAVERCALSAEAVHGTRAHPEGARRPRSIAPGARGPE